jgi:hypothetical protein
MTDTYTDELFRCDSVVSVRHTVTERFETTR